MKEFFNVIIDALNVDSILKGPDLNQIRKELENLLGCGVLVTTESQIQPEYLSLIRTPYGTVTLHDANVDIDSSELTNQLDVYYGKDWIFKDQQKTIDESFTGESSGFYPTPISQIQKPGDLSADSDADLAEVCEAVRHYLGTLAEADKAVAIERIEQVLQEAKPAVKPTHI